MGASGKKKSKKNENPSAEEWIVEKGGEEAPFRSSNARRTSISDYVNYPLCK